MFFEMLNSTIIAEEINKASNRVVYIAPGLADIVAESLIDAAKRLCVFSVIVILDCHETTFRLGYGTIEAIKKLQEFGIRIRQENGLRLGLLVCDEKAWSFAPIPLCIEEEPSKGSVTNAIRLLPEQADLLISKNCPNDLINKEGEIGRSLGKEIIKENQISLIDQQLKVAPPIQFNIFRVTQVFQPYIQHIDLSLKGCSINRRSIQIPQKILKLIPNKEIESRFRMTFNLIEKNSKISGKYLNDKLKKIKEKYLRLLGDPWGYAILRAKRNEFDKEIEKFKEEFKKFQERVKDNLQMEIDNSIEKIVEAFAERIKNDPPDDLMAQISGQKPTSQEARNWLQAELKKHFPDAEELIKEMKLTCEFKDFTYETLKDKSFKDALKKAFPAIDWDKPFNEFRAAEERVGIK